MNAADKLKAAGEWLHERFPLEKLNFETLFQKKEVPVHRMSWAYYMGGLALFFFTVQVVTGLMLLFYYQPTVADAHASVEYITHHVTGGALVRNVHAWAASAFIFVILVHVLTTFAMKAFDKPREITWISGVLLLLIAFGFGFTGYMLPWHQLGVNATKVGLQSIEQAGMYLPGALASIPTQLKELIQGEAAVGQATLSRFYALHVVLLPMAAMATIGLHVFMVQVHGMSQGVDKPSGKTEKFFPIFALKDFSVWGVVFFVLFVLALCLPFEAFFSYPLFEPFDPLGSTPDGIKPEWYFFFVYYPMELLPFWLIMLVSNVGVFVLLLAPWVFKRATRTTTRNIALMAAAYLVLMTLFGHLVYEFFKGAH